MVVMGLIVLLQCTVGRENATAAFENKLAMEGRRQIRWQWQQDLKLRGPR